MASEADLRIEMGQARHADRTVSWIEKVFAMGNEAFGRSKTESPDLRWRENKLPKRVLPF